MAVDTRDKRFSLIGLAKPMVRAFQNPAGSIVAAARAMLEFLYSGIPLQQPALATPRTISLLASVSAYSLTASRDTSPSLQASVSAYTLNASE